jgi:hypothetical protein
METSASNRKLLSIGLEKFTFGLASARPKGAQFAGALPSIALRALTRFAREDAVRAKL